MCGPAAGSASCSACDASKALFESNFELPSCPSIYINSHSIYIIPSHCIILYLQCAGLCRPLPLSHWGWNTRGLPRHSFAKNKARGSCIIDGISFRERSSLPKFALHLAIGCLWWCLHGKKNGQRLRRFGMRGFLFRDGDAARPGAGEASWQARLLAPDTGARLSG